MQFRRNKKQRIAREQEQPPQTAEPEETPVPQAAPQNEQERSGLQIVAVDTLTGNVLETPSYDLYTMDGANGQPA